MPLRSIQRLPCLQIEPWELPLVPGLVPQHCMLLVDTETTETVVSCVLVRLGNDPGWSV